MPAADGDRTKHFPAIEKKHGEPIKVWLKRLKDLGDAKYPEQIAFLRENHGFSQAHANALVMYARGSVSSKKFSSPEDFFATLDPMVARNVKLIFSTITKKHPDFELVTAWNQPMLRKGKDYVFGLSAGTAAAILLLQEQGKLRVSDRLDRHRHARLQPGWQRRGADGYPYGTGKSLASATGE